MDLNLVDNLLKKQVSFLGWTSKKLIFKKLFIEHMIFLPNLLISLDKQHLSHGLVTDDPFDKACQLQFLKNNLLKKYKQENWIECLTIEDLNYYCILLVLKLTIDFENKLLRNSKGKKTKLFIKNNINLNVVKNIDLVNEFKELLSAKKSYPFINN